MFWILSARNHGLIPTNRQHISQKQVALDGRRRCVLGGISKVSFVKSSLNPVRFSLFNVISKEGQIAQYFAWKGTMYQKRCKKAIFPPKRSIELVFSRLELQKITKLRGATTLHVFYRPFSVRLPYVLVDGSHWRSSVFILINI